MKYTNLSLLPPSTSPAGASYWLNLNRSQRANGPLRQPMQVSFLGTEKWGEGTDQTQATAQLYSCVPYFPHSVERSPSKSLMKMHEIYCPPGVSGVTKPQTQLHGLLSPSQSSFPKGNNTCPKAPPATATSLNLHLPGADSKSQKRIDFSRER